MSLPWSKGVTAMYICKKCGNRISMRDGVPFMCFRCHTMQESDFVYYTEDFCIDLYNEYTELVSQRNPQSITEWRILRSEFGKSKGLKPCTVKTLAYYGSVLPGARHSLRKAVVYRVSAAHLRMQQLIAIKEKEE